ncbi:hypothetical protein DT075_22420 [Bacillus licheniformis]|nr:hypothetical protein DT075_22420 [Bacillus licheniformis]
MKTKAVNQAKKAFILADVSKFGEFAQEAASLLEEGDCIYLDAGTTTLQMIDFINPEMDIIVVTNGVMHIEALGKKGITFYLLGGYVKYK